MVEGTKIRMNVNLLTFANMILPPNVKIGLLVLAAGSTISLTFATKVSIAKIGML